MILGGLIIGCDGPVPVTGVTREEALTRVGGILTEEHELNAIVTEVDNTLYIYIPLEFPILSIKGTPKGPQQSDEVSESDSLKYINVQLAQKNFLAKYEISNNRGYSADPGYAAGYDKRFQQVQINVNNAIKQAYFDVGEVPGDVKYRDGKKKETHEALVNAYVKTDTPPEFIVVIYADIVNGIKSVQKFYFLDFKRAQGLDQSISMDEYVKRTISKVEGHQDIIGDTTGKHLDLTPIQLKDFIPEQIEHRIRFKYTQSSLPPAEDPIDEIKIAIAQTVGAYEYYDFETAICVNLLDGTKSNVAKHEITSLPEANPQKPSKMHVIQFDYGNTGNEPKGL